MKQQRSKMKLIARQMGLYLQKHGIFQQHQRLARKCLRKNCITMRWLTNHSRVVSNHKSCYMLPSLSHVLCPARASMNDKTQPVILPRHGRWTSLFSCYTLAAQKSFRPDPLSRRFIGCMPNGMFLLPQSNISRHEPMSIVSRSLTPNFASRNFLTKTWGKNSPHLQPALRWRHLPSGGNPSSEFDQPSLAEMFIK